MSKDIKQIVFCHPDALFIGCPGSTELQNLLGGDVRLVLVQSQEPIRSIHAFCCPESLMHCQ